MKVSLEHSVYVGTTRYGKTKAALLMNVARLAGFDAPAYVWLDPPGIGVEEFYGHAVKKGMAGKIIYDRLCETEYAPGYDFFTPSDNKDKEQRIAENRERMEEAKAIMIRVRGELGTNAKPNTNKGLNDALNLFINQKTRVPFQWLKDCFTRETDAAQALLSNCNSMESILRFQRYHGLRSKDWDYECGPAQKILEEFCTSPQFARRCVPTFDFAEHLNSGGHLLVDGRSRGNLSRPDMSFLMGMIILKVIQLARGGKLKRRVVLVIDEAKNAGLIDGNLERASAEAAKWDLELQIILQNPIGHDDLFQCFSKIFLFRQINRKAVEFAAELVGIPMLEPLKIRYTETRYRTVEDGMIEIPTESITESEGPDGQKRTGVTKGTQFRPKRIEVTEDQQHYWSLDDQITLKQQQIATLKVGECFIKRGDYVSKTPEKMPLLEEPWKSLRYSRTQSLTQKKVELALAEMVKRPLFQRPAIQSPPCPQPKLKGAAKRLSRGGKDENS